MLTKRRLVVTLMFFAAVVGATVALVLNRGTDIRAESEQTAGSSTTTSAPDVSTLLSADQKGLIFEYGQKLISNGWGIGTPIYPEGVFAVLFVDAPTQEAELEALSSRVGVAVQERRLSIAKATYLNEISAEGLSQNGSCSVELDVRKMAYMVNCATQANVDKSSLSASYPIIFSESDTLVDRLITAVEP